MIYLLYDGYCNFCTRLVLWLKKIDKKNILQAVPATSEQGNILVVKYNISEDLQKTLGVIKNNHVYYRSEAVFEILKAIGGIWQIFYFFKHIVPKKFSDWVYNVIAKNRYKLFGKHDACETIK